MEGDTGEAERVETIVDLEFNPSPIPSWKLTNPLFPLNTHTSVGDGSLETEGESRSCKALHYQDGSVWGLERHSSSQTTGPQVSQAVSTVSLGWFCAFPRLVYWL